MGYRYNSPDHVGVEGRSGEVFDHRAGKATVCSELDRLFCGHSEDNNDERKATCRSSSPLWGVWDKVNDINGQDLPNLLSLAPHTSCKPSCFELRRSWPCLFNIHLTPAAEDKTVLLCLCSRTIAHTTKA